MILWDWSSAPPLNAPVFRWGWGQKVAREGRSLKCRHLLRALAVPRHRVLRGIGHTLLIAKGKGHTYPMGKVSP